MTNRQRLIMILKEALLVGTIGFIIGIIVGIIFSMLIINIIQKYILTSINNSNLGFYFGDNIFYMGVTENIKLHYVMPVMNFFIIGVTVYTIILISCLLPIKNLNKLTLIETIKGKEINKIDKKRLKTSKTISKIFGISGEIAYKNIRKEKSNYKTIVISITISIIIFLVADGFAKNLFYETNDMLNYNQNRNYTYNITDINKSELEQVINYLKKDNLVQSYGAYRIGLMGMSERATDILIPADKISDSIKKSIENNVNLTFSSNFLEDGSMVMNSCFAYYILGNEYDHILNKVGISSLAKNEVIISNTTRKEESKYGDLIEYTKYNVRRYIKICYK